jgi:hypothetical protein
MSSGLTCAHCGQSNSKFDVRCNACGELLVSLIPSKFRDPLDVPVPEPQWTGVANGAGRGTGLVIGRVVADFVKALFSR